MFDVIIVGCGPTGAALANALGGLGLSVQVLDRHVGVVAIPRAVHLDAETMRILQGMGLAGALLSILRPGGGMHWVNAAGDTLLLRAAVQGLGIHGWHNDYYFHQPQLESVLRAGLERYPGVRLLEGVEVREIRALTDGVEVQWVSVGGGAPETLRARYVVGCDGARSTVRQWVGGEDFEDLGDHQAWLVVDGVLHRPLDLPEHSVQHCDPSRPATSIYISPLRRRWELMLLPGEDTKSMTEPALVWDLLKRWVKPSQATLERAATYVFHSLVARRWQNARVFLAGDAVHQTPPFLGQGLCAGIRDVANLAWKLAFAVKDPVHGPAVLATYGPERRPHALAFVELAVEVGKIIQVTDPLEAAQRDARLLSQGLQVKMPAPPLGEGVHRARPDRPSVGAIAPQFELPDGTWSDDNAAQRWTLLSDETMTAGIDASMRQRLASLDIVTLEMPGERAQSWLAGQGAHAALLRPDRYLFDLCGSAQELRASLGTLSQWIGGEG